ncbi:MAG TPA: hypothetical protein VK674_05395 [Candidatus Limnocylindria bacterium]|nr:hypothetical protein [Candidatus Limnocylindria bacterium]
MAESTFWPTAYAILGTMKGRGSQLSARLRFSALQHRSEQGYTIVEVMVFLAVTTAIFVMIASSFSTRQNSAEFSVAVREMESRLQDIANDTSTGYYNNPGNFRCRLSGGAPFVEPGTNAQGTNNDCIFIGRVVQFDLGGSNGKDFNLYSVVGARQAAGADVEDFDDANPLALAPSARFTASDLTETQQVPPGLVIRSVYSDNAGVRRQVRSVGFFTSFGAGAANTTSLGVNILPLAFNPVGNSKNDTVGAINLINNASPSNPSNGVVICMDGDATNQHALLRLGGNERQLTTGTTVEAGTCASAGY